MKMFPLQISTFSILIVILVVIPSLVTPFETIVVDKKPGYKKLELPSSAFGPESFAFDADNRGPYTSVYDGRILKWNGHTHEWTDFSIPPRQRVSNEECQGHNKCGKSATMEDKCGRPLGLQFHKATGDLYIADAYYGLVVVCKRGGVASKLASSADGVAFKFTNGIDIDQRTGVVYFTDSSSVFQRREYGSIIATNDSTGRFMSYNPKTKKVKVLIRNIEFPNGVCLNKNGSFVLICQSTRNPIIQYWLKGPKARSVHVFANLREDPDNIKTNTNGEFWVGIHSTLPKTNVIGMKLGESGKVLEALELSNLTNKGSEVLEKRGTLWLGSIDTSFVVRYSKARL